MFQVGLPCYLGLNSGRSVSINVNNFPETFMTRMSPQYFPVSHTGNIATSISFLFSRCKLCLRYTAGILTKIRACEHLQKFCENEQASTHLIFASNSSKGQILRALSNLMGPFDTPLAFLQAFEHAISVFTTAQSGIWVRLLVTSLWEPS